MDLLSKGQDTDLHCAIRHGRTSKVKALLLDGADVTCQNEDGDQPAHIAARLGSAECMELLIAFGAPLGRRNWAGLTPVGEARMNLQTSVVDLLERSFILRGKTSLNKPSKWDITITETLQGWEEVYDEHRQQTYWVRNRGSKQEVFSLTPPAVSLSLVNNARAANERIIVRRHSLTTAMLIDAKHHYEKERASNLKMISDLTRNIRAVDKLHRIVRGKRAQKLLERKQHEHSSSILLQKYWRGCFRSTLYGKYRFSALKVQTLYRMCTAVHFFRYFQYERLWMFRATRLMAIAGQRLWRGYKGRMWARRQLEIRSLPDPFDPRSFEFWLECQKQSRPPKNKYGVFLEYTLGGTPASWADRRIKRNGRFRDVKYYANSITNKVQWEMPDEWKRVAEKNFQEREQLRLMGYEHNITYASIRIQALWQAKRARRRFRMIMRAKKISDDAELEYFNRPNDIKAICNYALKLHVLEQDYDKARPMYCAMLQYMHHRGVDNPFVLYGCAIFGAVTNEEDWDVIKDFVARAKATKGMPYDLAEAGFYRIAALRSQTGESWHNYALCRMLVYDDLDGATDAFIRAMKASPGDKRIMRNFDVLVHDPHYLGKPESFDALTEFLRIGQEGPQLQRAGQRSRIINHD